MSYTSPPDRSVDHFAPECAVAGAFDFTAQRVGFTSSFAVLFLVLRRAQLLYGLKQLAVNYLRVRADNIKLLARRRDCISAETAGFPWCSAFAAANLRL